MRIGSVPVQTRQTRVHRGLLRAIDRHSVGSFRKPAAAHTREAFARFFEWYRGGTQPVIFDAGCGTGASVLSLAALHSSARILGVDRSAARLGRAPALDTRHLLLRADLVDFWRLLHQAQLRLASTYILYPNPHPKAKHLGRRWHAHPVFPELLATTQCVELRTNWHVYAQEFAVSLDRFGCHAIRLEEIAVEQALTPFERKYAARGQPLYCVMGATP